MSSSPALNALFEAARDEWSDPRQAAVAACDALLDLTAADWQHEGQRAVTLLRQKRRDSALMLAVSEAGMWEDPGQAARSLGSVRARLLDDTWAVTIAGALAAIEGAIHVMSIGDTTVAVLEELSRIADAVPLIHAHQAAVARGLGYLDVALAVAAPDKSVALLLPLAALHAERVWTTPTSIDVASGYEGAVIPVHHPLAEMSPLSRQQFRPHPGLVSTRIR